MENLAPNDLWTALLVFLAICAAIVTIGKAIETIKKIKVPSTDIMTMLANDKHKLEQHDKELIDLKDGLQQMCSGVVALLNHELRDGNSDEMDQAARNINDWLIHRR